MLIIAFIANFKHKQAKSKAVIHRFLFDKTGDFYFSGIYPFLQSLHSLWCKTMNKIELNNAFKAFKLRGLNETCKWLVVFYSLVCAAYQFT